MNPAKRVVAAVAACGIATAGAAAERPAAVDLLAAYTAETWHAVEGGRRIGDAYLDSLDLQLVVDGERALGVAGLTLAAYVLYNNGTAFDGRYFGSAHAISSIETSGGWRLFEAWADLARARGSLRVGILNLGSEFDVNATGAVFVNPAHGTGTDFSQSGENGPSIFADTSLGLRGAVVLGDWSARVAVMDGVPNDPAQPGRTRIRLGGDDGALVVGEVERRLGERGRAAAGAWHYTATFDDLVAVDESGAPVRRRGSSGAYGIVEGRVFAERADDAQGLGLFLRAGLADEAVNPIAGYVGTGAVYAGPLPSRPRDQLGFAVAYARLGDPAREAARRAGLVPAAAETNLELTWRIEIAAGWHLQPDVQFVVDPAGNAAADDPWVFGLRLKGSWRR